MSQVRRTFSLTMLASALLDDAAPENASAFVDGLIRETLDPQRTRYWRNCLLSIRDLAGGDDRASLIAALDDLIART